MDQRSAGPFLVAAAVCEQVIEGKDGRITIVNVIEQVTHTATGPDVPDEMPKFPFNAKVIVALKSGAAKGRYAIRLQPETPSGIKLPTAEFPVQFQGGSSGVRVFGDLQLELDAEGLYWIDVTLIRGRGDEKAEDLLTRVPLNVLYQPQKTIPGGAPDT